MASARQQLRLVSNCVLQFYVEALVDAFHALKLASGPNHHILQNCMQPQNLQDVVTFLASSIPCANMPFALPSSPLLQVHGRFTCRLIPQHL